MNSMLFLLSCVLFFVAFATATAASDTSSSFIREKYLDELYNQQYCYTLQQIQHNPEICPEFHSSAMYFAITGRRRFTQTCRHIHHTTVTPLQPRDIIRNNNNNSYVLLSDIIIIILTDIAYYTFEYGMLLISVILASCSTLFMIMLLFCQY